MLNRFQVLCSFPNSGNTLNLLFAADNKGKGNTEADSNAKGIL